MSITQKVFIKILKKSKRFINEQINEINELERGYIQKKPFLFLKYLSNAYLKELDFVCRHIHDKSKNIMITFGRSMIEKWVKLAYITKITSGTERRMLVRYQFLRIAYRNYKMGHDFSNNKQKKSAEREYNRIRISSDPQLHTISGEMKLEKFPSIQNMLEDVVGSKRKSEYYSIYQWLCEYVHTGLVQSIYGSNPFVKGREYRRFLIIMCAVAAEMIKLLDFHIHGNSVLSNEAKTFLDNHRIVS